MSNPPTPGITIALALAMALALLTGPNLDRFDAWRADLARAQAEQTAQDLALHIQAQCGPNTGARVCKSGALECTTKRGQCTGQQITEVTP